MEKPNDAGISRRNDRGDVAVDDDGRLDGLESDTSRPEILKLDRFAIPRSPARPALSLRIQARTPKR
jgi:hypothetical protein